MTTTPDTPSNAWIEMEEKASIIYALMGGTKTMREAGRTLLPPHKGEDLPDLDENGNLTGGDTNYEKRLKKSVLTPYLSEAIKTYVSKPLSQGVLFSEDFNQQLVEYSDDIDLEGTDITTFSKEVLKDAFAYGKSHILVDTTRTQAANGVETTLADEIGIRPYFTHIKARQVLDWDYSTIGGVTQLSMVRYQFSERVRISDFETDIVSKVRVLKIGSYETYVETDTGWMLDVEDSGDWLGYDGQPLKEIPFLTYYSNELAPMIAESPFMELAYMNVQHWQNTSEVNNIVSWTNTPILVGVGTRQSIRGDEPEPEPILFGAGFMVEVPSGGDIKYVEHTGAAIEKAQEHIDRLEERMSVAAITPLVSSNRSGNITATADAISAAEATATLKSLTVLFEKFLLKAFKKMGLYNQLFQDDIGSIDLNTDFHVTVDSSEFDNIINMKQLGIITEETVLQEAKRRNIISDDVNVTDEIEKAEIQVFDETTTLLQ